MELGQLSDSPLDTRPQFSTRGNCTYLILDYSLVPKRKSGNETSLGTRLERLLVSFPGYDYYVRGPCHVHADLSQGKIGSAVDLGLEFSSRECLSK